MLSPRSLTVLRRAARTAIASVLACCAPGEGGDSPRGQGEEPDIGWSIGGAQVLYTARRDGASDIYVMDRTIGRERRITRFGTAEGGANYGRLSPDGSRLAFQVRRGTDYEIHVMELPDGESRNVTRHPEYDVTPAWSPDGRRIAFMSTRGFALGSIGPFPGHIYVLTLSTDSLVRVTREPLTSSLGPTDWSRDGTTLLMARVVDERPALFALDVETGSERRIASPASGAGEYVATYSHSGDRIAFHSETEDASHIVVTALDGSERTTLTRGPGFRYGPRWSPDDAWLLFTASDDGEQWDLRAVSVADGRVVEVVATPEDEREGSWWHASR